MKRKLQKTDLDQMELPVFKWKCDKGIVFVNGVLVREIFIRENIGRKERIKEWEGWEERWKFMKIVDVRSKRVFK